MRIRQLFTTSLLLSPIGVLTETTRRQNFLRSQAKFQSANLDRQKSMVRNDVKLFQYASAELKDDRAFILEIAKQDFALLECASNSLRDDKKFMLEVVKINGNALEYASDKLRGDKVLVIEAVKQDVNALRFASKELQNIALPRPYLRGTQHNSLIDIAYQSYLNAKTDKEKDIIIQTTQLIYIKYLKDVMNNDDKDFKDSLLYEFNTELLQDIEYYHRNEESEKNLDEFMTDTGYPHLCQPPLKFSTVMVCKGLPSRDNIIGNLEQAYEKYQKDYTLKYDSRTIEPGAKYCGMWDNAEDYFQR